MHILGNFFCYNILDASVTRVLTNYSNAKKVMGLSGQHSIVNMKII